MYDFVNSCPTFYNNQHHILPLVIAGIAAAGATLVGSAISSSTAAQSQSETNELNAELQRETNAMNQANFNRSFDYTVQQNSLVQQREDTAHQREVNDLRAAGLSPLASVNGSNAGQVVSAPTIPNLVAPQMDATGYLQAAGALSHIGEIGQLFTNLYSIESENARAEAKNDLDKTLTFAQMSNELAKTEKLIASNESIAGSQNANSLNIAIKQMKNELDLLELQNGYENSRQAARLSHEVEQKLRDKGVYDFTRYKDFKKYEDAMKVYNAEYDTFFTEWNENLKKYSSSESSGIGANLGFGKGNSDSTNRSIAGEIFDKVSSAANFKVDGGFNKSSSEFESKDFSQLFFAAEKKWHIEHPRPLYVGK